MDIARVTASPAFLKLTRDPSLPVPPRFERTKKEPGSWELVRGEWVQHV